MYCWRLKLEGNGAYKNQLNRKIANFITMMPTTFPIQPPAIVSYLRVGKLLYYSLLLFILEAWFYWTRFKAAYMEISLPWIVFWFICFVFAFVHIFLVVMDGWSRFQNYKRAKDQFYVHGFRKRIADTYMGSQCQRMAAIVAAEELGIGDVLREYYFKRNVKWYHLVPYFMIKDPVFFLKKKFWSRTFLEKNYIPRFDYRNLQSQFELQP
jgi:hypothetical protein